MVRKEPASAGFLLPGKRCEQPRRRQVSDRSWLAQQAFPSDPNRSNLSCIDSLSIRAAPKRWLLLRGSVTAQGGGWVAGSGACRK